MKGLVKFEMSVPAHIHEKDGIFVASCPALDVVSQGDDKEQALANLTEALQLFVETCYEMGTLGDVLREQGLQPGEAEEDIDDEDWIRVPVPLSLIATNAQACAA